MSPLIAQTPTERKAFHAGVSNPPKASRWSSAKCQTLFHETPLLVQDTEPHLVTTHCDWGSNWGFHCYTLTMKHVCVENSVWSYYWDSHKDVLGVISTTFSVSEAIINGFLLYLLKERKRIEKFSLASPICPLLSAFTSHVAGDMHNGEGERRWYWVTEWAKQQFLSPSKGPGEWESSWCCLLAVQMFCAHTQWVGGALTPSWQQGTEERAATCTGLCVPVPQTQHAMVYGAIVGRVVSSVSMWWIHGSLSALLLLLLLHQQLLQGRGAGVHHGTGPDGLKTNNQH